MLMFVRVQAGSIPLLTYRIQYGVDVLRNPECYFLRGSILSCGTARDAFDELFVLLIGIFSASLCGFCRERPHNEHFRF